jgi:flagellar biosynthesis anti-sigma factor FlgM
MKIVTESQQPTGVQQNIESRGDKPELVAVRPKKGPKSSEKKDTVELSESSVETELKTREAEQAKRVQALKELIQSGKYQVSSREVAEKMLSGSPRT